MNSEERERAQRLIDEIAGWAGLAFSMAELESLRCLVRIVVESERLLTDSSATTQSEYEAISVLTGLRSYSEVSSALRCLRSWNEEDCPSLTLNLESLKCNALREYNLLWKETLVDRKADLVLRLYRKHLVIAAANVR